MRIVHHNRKFFRYRHGLNTPLNLSVKKRLLNHPRANPKFQTDCSRRHRIVYRKLTWDIYFNIKFHLPRKLVGNKKPAPVCMQTDIFSAQGVVRTGFLPLPDPIFLYRAVRTCKHGFPMRIIRINKRHPALLKKQSLARHILFKTCMFPRSDMIRLNIG